ncbi:TylF/MycF/NovP-related O-methyltransferase [Acetobacterium wieringae]|uniref:Macrocin-O-methyltransferase (TylF) n=1 Tax=Acetobacterium wieringae TaxID=52694 RepID=A0A1F2PF88_9FIRM|nr:TylF/MycF/NovP-related O-methyltransferase [Acetobacterium wieringae]OFV70029.1 macrocin-O-methyltransferase (TylF) [Acetobacterium wieringae]
MISKEKKYQNQEDLNQFKETEKLFRNENIDLIDKIESFGKYATRQSIAKFLTKYELFQKIIGVNGSIIECGVLHGNGLLTWAKLSSIFEPVNHTRKVVGFDTFEGFPSIHGNDDETGISGNLKIGGMKGSSFNEIVDAIKVYDINRAINQIPKVELVQGDLCQTAEKYIEENPHTVISLLYLDLDLYEPTKKALEIFVPHMPKGAIIAFDELNAKTFPGETKAVDEVLGIKNLEIKRFFFDPYVSYVVIG